MFPTPIAERGRLANISYRVLLILALLIWLLPLFAVALTSIRGVTDFNTGNYWGWPSEFLLVENYTQIFTQTPMGRYLWNTVLITVPTVIGTITLSTLAGFALAKYYDFRPRTWLFALFIAGNFVPFQILMIPVRNLTISFGLYDTITGLVMFHVAFQVGFCTLFMRNFISTLPDSLIEAARCEGAGEWLIFTRIVLPLVRPALAALAVLIFTFIWNDFFWALVLVQSDSARPVTAGISALKGQWLASWQLISAGSIVAALPPVAMFFAMQRNFIAGLTLGANKG